jgi:hypothetical protein
LDATYSDSGGRLAVMEDLVRADGPRLVASRLFLDALNVEFPALFGDRHSVNLLSRVV